MTRMQLNVEGVTYEDEVEPRLLLIHYLRDSLGRGCSPVSAPLTVLRAPQSFPGRHSSTCGAVKTHQHCRTPSARRA